MKELVFSLMLVSAHGDAMSKMERDYVLNQCSSFVDWAKTRPKKLYHSDKEWNAFIIGCTMGAEDSDDFLPGQRM